MHLVTVLPCLLILFEIQLPTWPTGMWYVPNVYPRLAAQGCQWPRKKIITLNPYVELYMNIKVFRQWLYRLFPSLVYEEQRKRLEEFFQKK